MTIYVATPFRASSKAVFDEQIEWTKKVSRELVLNRLDIITPHLYYTQFLNEDIGEERKLGLESARRLIEKCDAIFVSVKNPISQGMEAEIDRAEELGLPIYYFKSVKELKVQIEKAKLDLGQENKK